MSKVDFQRKKKDEEEQKVVGQQQKTQSTANKPTGTTSIPKDNQGISGRTQKSAASFSRTEEKRATENERVVKKNTFTANSAENRRNQPTKTTNSSTENRRTTYADFSSRKQNHSGSGGTWGYNKTVDDARSRYAMSLKNGGIPGPESLPTIDEFKRSQMLDADRIKDIAKNVDIGQFKTKQAPLYRNGVNWNYKPEENPVIKGSDIGIKENITPEIEQQMLSPGYKLDNDARKIAREYAQQELSKYTSGPGGVPQLNSDEDRQRYAELRGLANKTSPLASFMEGVADPFEKVGTFVRDVLPKSEEAKARNEIIDQYRSQAKANASAQNPILTGAGQLAGNAAEYALTEPVVGLVANAVGATSAAGKFLINQVANAGQDALLSWAPTLNELAKRDDLTPGQKAIEMAKTMGLDLGGNLIGGGIGLARDLRKAAPDATEQLIKNVTNQSEQAASNIDNLAKQIPEVPVNSVTDIPYGNVDEVIQPNINNAFGGGNPFSASKDEAIKRLTALGGDTGNMAGPYHDLLNAADKESIDDFTRAYQAYQDAAKANNMNGFDRPLQRLNDAVNGYMPENVSPELLNSTNSNIDAIEDGLNRISRLEGLSDLGKKHLDSSYELLNQYDDAIRNGGDVQKIAEDLSRTLGNLDNQAKKLDGYDGVFSAWKGGGTARGDLYSNTGNIPKEMNLETTPEEKAMFDEWNNRDAETMHAVPANGPTNAEIPNNVAPKVENVEPEVKAPESVPNAESLPEASTDIPSMDDASRKTFDRGPEGRIVDTDDIKERGYARSTRNNPDIPDEVAADFVDNPEIYNVLHNKDTKAKAQAILDKGFDNAYADYKDLLNKKDPAAVPLGYDLAKQMIENGDSRGAADLIRDMSKSLTESGQFSQAAAITLMRNDPMTALRYADKELDALNKEGAKKFKNWTDFKLTDDEIKAFNALDPGDKEGITKLFDQIGTRLGKEYPTTAMEKLLEARRVGMLFNVRTNVRNFGANVPTLGMRWASDRVDAVGQNIAHIINPDFKVTQSLTGSGKHGRKLATEVFNSEKVQNLLKNTDGKYADSVKGALVKEKQMYKGTAVDRWIDKMTGGGLQKLNEKAFGKKGVQSIPETIRNATYKALELGDSPFVKENFIERLGSYIKAQGYKSIDEIPDEAIETAWEAAMKATYKDQSWAYKMIRDIKAGIGQAGKPGKVVSESLIPFVQAPGNIAARMVDYSPVGAANGVKNIIKGAKSGSEKAVREGINQLAQGATGSLALGIGIALHNSGLITGGYSQDKDKKSHEKNNGFREYALHIGDHYYTIDWAQPAFQTIMTGVLLADAINKSDEYDSDLLNYFGVKGSTAGKVIGASKEAAKTTINAWFNASPLQSMQDLLGGTYEDSSDIASKLWSVAAENFAGSYVPASVNAVAKTMDTTQRQTYDPSSKTASFVNSQIAKIPGLSEKLPAKYNTWGEEIKTADSTGEAAFNRFLNPGEGTKENKKPIDTELDRLFDATGNNAVYPQVAPNKVNGEALTSKQVSDLQKNMGERSLEAANKFMDSDVYKEMSDEQKAEGYNDLYNTVKWAAQLEMSDPETYKKMQEGDEEALKTISGNGASMKKKYITEGIDSVIDDIAFGQKKTEIDTTGNGSVTQDELLNYINNGHQDEADKLWDKFKGNSNSTLTKDENGVYTLVDSKGAVKYGTDSLSDEDKAIISDLEEMGFTKSSTQDKYKQAQNVIPGLTTQEFGDTYKAIDTDNSESINQDEVLSYLNDNKVTSQSEADKIWAAYGNNWKSIPSLVNGEWASKSSKSKSTSSNNSGIKPTGNNDLDTKLKAKQKVREDYQKNKIPIADDLPEANQSTASSDGLNWQLNNGYNLKTTKTYERAQAAGIPDSDFVNAFWAADTSGNGKITKDEAKAYLNALNDLSQEEKRKWFDVLVTRKSKNPY